LQELHRRHCPDAKAGATGKVPEIISILYITLKINQPQLTQQFLNKFFPPGQSLQHHPAPAYSGLTFPLICGIISNNDSLAEV
jgi:hypothetical protein